MRNAEFDPAKHVDHMEHMLGLTIEDAWRPIVIAHMTAIARAGNQVMNVALVDEIEPAPVFLA
jgi:hypothetical protein